MTDTPAAPTTRSKSAIALDRLMAVINERTTIEPRHRSAIRASLRAYRRAIEAEARSTPAEPLDDPLVTIKELRITADEIEGAIESLGHPGYKNEAIIYTAALAAANTLRRLSRNEEGGSFYGDQQDDPHQPDGEANR